MKKKKQLLIIDTATLTRNKEIYGHGLNVAKNYVEVLGQWFDCYVAGGKTYKNEFEKYIKLPFVWKYGENGVVKNIKGLINAVCSLLIKSDIYLFQCQYIIPVYVCLCFFPFLAKEKKIYVIIYNDPMNNPIFPTERKWVLRAQKNISGFIASNERWISHLNGEKIVLPDYLPIAYEVSGDKKYDFGVFGTISEWKDCEMVVAALNNTKYSCLIAGHFEDKERKTILEQSIDSEKILVKDEYLDSDEYDRLLSEVSCVILPYEKKYYEKKSSGVVLEALYRGIPVIAPRIESFMFVEQNDIGWLYEDSIGEVIDTFETIEQKKANISKYFGLQEKKLQEQILQLLSV